MMNKNKLLKLACQMPFKASKVAIQYIRHQWQYAQKSTQTDTHPILIDGETGKIIYENREPEEKIGKNNQSDPSQHRLDQLMMDHVKKHAFMEGVAILQSQNLSDDLAEEAMAELRDAYLNL